MLLHHLQSAPTTAPISDSALILEASRVLDSRRERAEKIASVLRLLSDWAQLRFARVLLPHYPTRTLEVAYAYGLQRARIEDGTYSVPFDQGLTGAVWRSGQAALVTDVADEPVFLTRIVEPMGDCQKVAFLCVPIQLEGRPVGVLSAQRDPAAERLYSRDIDLLRVIASLFGSILSLMPQPGQRSSTGRPRGDDERLRCLCAEHAIIGGSTALLDAVRQIDNAKFSDAPILLLGESGTGKEMFAQMIHRLSTRRDGAYIPLNCGAIPDQLLESELFGHEKGSFTGAHRNKKGKLQLADGGTLFLDEIGDMPLDLQVKLLRVLQDRQVEPVGGERAVKVDFRLITATHVDLHQAIDSGRFRLDLFFRLNVMPISLPALRERPGDIPLLTDHFLRIYQGMYRRSVALTAGVMDQLVAHPWPGNIRQLQNVLERAVLQADGAWITDGQIAAILATESAAPAVAGTCATGLMPAATQPAGAIAAAQPSTTAAARYRPYRRVEPSQVDDIAEALAQTHGNQTQAAALLGMTHRQLRYRLAKLSVSAASLTGS